MMKKLENEIFSEFVEVLKQEVDPAELKHILAGGELQFSMDSACSPELARAIGEVMSFLVTAIPPADLLP